MSDDEFEFPNAHNFDPMADEAEGDDEVGLLETNPSLEIGEEKEIGKNGLRKKLIKDGEGWGNPNSGDEAEVHYVGTLLDGTQFDSSRDKSTPFKFKLGQGQVIKGWDEAIKTMKKGEKALFTIPAEMAYGESGSPPAIPTNATLQFEIELLSWTSVKDICKDGGIFKKVLVEGEGWQNPKDLDEVFVRYEARLMDGTFVSNSDGIEFAVKDGCFCPALAKAVKTMKKGENALLTVNPQYAFGETGRTKIDKEVDIPPNATLQIDLELVSWKSVSNVTNDKMIMKKILKEGEGYEHPDDCTIVKVKLTGTLQDGTIFVRKGDDVEPFEFKIDESQVIDGLDRGVRTMKKGEIALITIQPDYAFGSSESSQDLAVVPGSSVVCYQVEMVSFTKEKESWDMSIQEKIEMAAKKKDEGNRWFKAGKYKRASRRYEKGVGFIEYDSNFSDEEKQQSKVLKISCNLNIAACKLKLKEFKEAATLCTEVLELDSRNIKALYRRAQAYIQLVELDLAEKDIKQALEIDPVNRDVKMEYKILKEKVKEYNRKDMQFYGTIFSKMSKEEQLKSTDADTNNQAMPMTKGTVPFIALSSVREKTRDCLSAAIVALRAGLRRISNRVYSPQKMKAS